MLPVKPAGRKLSRGTGREVNYPSPQPQRQKPKPSGFSFCSGPVKTEPQVLNCCGEDVIIDTRSKGFETDYRLTTKVLGHGVNGEVREAVSIKRGIRVAVKTFNIEDLVKSKGSSPTAQHVAAIRAADLCREVTLQSGLGHPSIAHIKGVYENKTHVRVVLELLSGGELFTRIADNGPLGDFEAAELACGLLQAVAYLHDQHIVHRDIKPENMIYERRGGSRFKLIDFGFASVLLPGEKLLDACGTIQYMAPEILSHKGYDEQCDLWSVGCTIYAALTCRSIYKGSEEEVRAKSAAGQVDWSSRFPALSADAQDFIKLLLTPDPKKRPGAEEALKHRWVARLTNKALSEISTHAPTEATDLSATHASIKAALGSSPQSSLGFSGLSEPASAASVSGRSAAARARAAPVPLGCLPLCFAFLHR